MEPHYQKLRVLLTETVVQFCRDNGCFGSELRIQGTVCVTADSSSFFVTQIAENLHMSDLPDSCDTTSEDYTLKNDNSRKNHDNSNQETMKNLQILVSKQGIASKLKGRKFGKKKMLGRRLASHGKYHRDKNEFSELIQPKIEPAVNHSQSIGSDEHVLSTCESLNSTNGLPIFTQSQLGVDGNSALSEEDNNSGSMETEQSKFSQQNAWSDVSAADYVFNQAQYIASMNRTLDSSEGNHASHFADPAPLSLDHDMSVLREESNNTKMTPPGKLAVRLTQYIRKEPPDKFVCTICGVEYNNRGSIHRHVEKHLGRVYKCDFCSCSFESHSGWSRHVRSKHPQHMNYSCTICPEKFAQQSALDQHLHKVHQGGVSANHEPQSSDSGTSRTNTPPIGGQARQDGLGTLGPLPPLQKAPFLIQESLSETVNFS